MNVSPQQPQLPLEFRTPPVANGTDMFTTHDVAMNSSPHPNDSFTDLQFRANTKGEDGAVFVAGTINDAFARARTATGFQRSTASSYVSEAAAVAQAADGYWILPVDIHTTLDDLGGDAYGESAPAFAPDFGSKYNSLDSRTWTKTDSHLVGIALRGKVLDMTKANAYTFDGYHQPPVS